jgi:antitoxin YefM
MNAMTYTTAVDNLSKTMEKVCTDHEPIIITRHKKQAVVMMSLEDYHSLEETAYLLRSPNNAKRLLESIQELERGNGRSKEKRYEKM